MAKTGPDSTIPDSWRQLLHSPDIAAKKRLAWARRMKDSPGVLWGIKSVDKRMIAMHPGDFVTIVGRPGHGKTSLLAWLAKTEAAAIMRRVRTQSEAVVYITWEQVIEEIDSLFYATEGYSATDIVRGNVDIDRLELDSIGRAKVPIWLIGISSEDHDLKNPIPRMTLEVVFQLCDTMEAEYGRRPTLILADYLQLIPVERARDIVSEVTFASGLLKELGMRVGCPTVAGVQARQEVDTYKEPIPTARDGQWASRTFQSCDKWLSVMKPSMYDQYRRKKIINLNGQNFDVEDSLFVLVKLKERFNKGRDLFPLYFDMEYLKLEETLAGLSPPVTF